MLKDKDKNKGKLLVFYSYYLHEIWILKGIIVSMCLLQLFRIYLDLNWIKFRI